MLTSNARVRSALAIVASTTIMVLSGCGGGATEEEGSPSTAPAAAAEPVAGPGAASAGPSGAVAPVASSGGSGPAPSPAATAGPAVPEADDAAEVGPPVYQATSSGLSSGGARMTFDKVVHDYGVVWDVQSDLPCEFPFRNDGTARLEIVDLKADCGCTVPALAKRSYEPGESGVINVLYSPKGIGHTEKFINLVTNVGGQGVARVAIRAENQRFVYADPPNLQFQPGVLGQPNRGVVTINSVDPDFVIEKVYTTQGSVHATGASDFLEAKLVDGSSPPQVEVALTEDAPWGSSFTTAYVEGTGTLPNGEERDFRVRIAVKADLFGDLHADRSYYSLRLILPGSSFEQAIRLWRESGEPFRVLGVEVHDPSMPGTKVEAHPFTDGDRTGYDIVVYGDTGSYLGVVNGSVVVKTDVPGEEELEMRFSGLVREASK